MADRISPPEAGPLDTPEQLLGWRPYAGGEAALCRGSVALPPRVAEPFPGQRPRLLACHDMAGGYHEDRFVQGCSPTAAASSRGGEPGEPYFLRHWRCLDLFVYLSHRLVTIPPPGWINAAHTHGVPVLGTLITEWEAGAAACRALFGSPAAAEAAAGALAAVAAFHRFEGWLINIENGVEAEHIPHLLHFLRVLTKRMKAVAPGWGTVLWYDAVTTEGKLEWQNTLNRLNRPFFDACDGMWINYTWGRGTPAAVRREAGGRAGDVFMGVDCFGRGTFGGGGFSCSLALQASAEQGLSAALFATAWPYEGDCGPGAPACWRERDELFWRLIEHSSGGGGGGGLAASFLQLLHRLWRWLTGAWPGHPAAPSHPAAGAAGAGRAVLPAAGVPRQLPLWSDFSIGRGGAMRLRGRLLRPLPWFNLSLQALQPLQRVQVAECAQASQSGPVSGSSGSGSSANSGGRNGWVRACVTEDASFSRGSSVRVTGSLRSNQQASVQLFPAAAAVPAAGLCVRLVAAVAGGQAAQARLAIRLSSAGSGNSNSGANGDGTCSVELPLLSPGTAAAAATPAAWSSPTAVVAAAAVGAQAAASSSGATAASATEAAPPAEAAAAAAPDWVAWEWQLTPALLAEAAAATASTTSEPEISSNGGARSSSRDARSSSGGGGTRGGGRALALAGVDLLLRGADSLATDEPASANSFSLLLGELCIEAAHSGGCPPAPPPGVRELQCRDVQLSRSASGSGGPVLLAARLAWQPPAAGSLLRCCHVWVAFSSAGGSQLARPAWLGTACADGFWACDVPVPAGAAAALFAVQAEGCNGLVEPLEGAARVAAELAPPAAAEAGV